MTTNKNIVSLCDVLSRSISDHHLVYLVLTLKTPRLKPSYITIRSYSNYNAERFREDLAFVPFHMISMFDDLDDQVDTFNALFVDVLNENTPIKRIAIKARPHSFITEEIRQLMNTRDIWHRRAIRSNDRLHWYAYRCFRQEVKRELRFAEMAHVRTELLKSKGNTNAIWKIINNCLPRKSRNRPFITENPMAYQWKFSYYLTANKILAKTQSGNRKLCSTETALLCVTDDLLQAVDDKKISALVLLDMSKAFDSIRHCLLLQKLQALGVSFSCRDWFHSYLVGRSQRVRIQDAISDVLSLKYGVPEGSILGPVLFTIYVNDLLSVPTYCKSACYVDDSKLYLSFPLSYMSTAIHNLNADLGQVSRWCCQNSLLINPDKD